LDTELSNNKDIQRQLQCGNSVHSPLNKLWASFYQCSNAVKNVLFSFLLYAHVCITIMA